MCTYLTEHVQIDGSGKGATGWFGANRATVYVDHPVHAPYGHTVNIDVINPDSARPRGWPWNSPRRARWPWPTRSVKRSPMRRSAWRPRTSR